MLPNRSKDKWLDTAVSGIRFYLDRRRVRQELESHIEDKMAGLRRSFPDIPEEEVQVRALSAMGDAQELRASLAKVHRPWLGRLWKASQWTTVLLMTVLLFLPHANEYSDPLWGRSGPEVYHRIQDGERARLGGYTFQITGAAYLDRPEEEGLSDSLQVVLRASSPRAWERIDPETVLDCLTVVGPGGTRYSMTEEGSMSCEHTITDEFGNTETRVCITVGGVLCRWGPTWREFAVFLPAEGWEPGDRVALELDSEAGSIQLSVPVTEKVRTR